ncbi:nuclear lim interactor-interacting [Lasius niger]|uniref:Nuclear lim interactor-interacting n=1 Tax=Lasius niger TaxID=67767 RepID=A0A0J7JYX9_LASNI|nr:nuclear lim interactor-interacting [Lasius niger]
MSIVCVLDMDETLGFSDEKTFYRRPKIEFLINFLRLQRIDIILWSLGKDEYVKQMMNGFLPEITKYAYKVFARNESERSLRQFEIKKASEHIRSLYDRTILLIGVDDRAGEVMDEGYDLRIQVGVYDAVKPDDSELVDVVEKIMRFCLDHQTREESE